MRAGLLGFGCGSRRLAARSASSCLALPARLAAASISSAPDSKSNSPWTWAATFFSRSRRQDLKRIEPGDDRINIAPELRGDKAAAPAVVHQRRHRRFAPFFILLAPKQQRAGNRFVAVHENIGFHRHGIAPGALRRKLPAVDLRRNALDHDATVRDQAMDWPLAA